MSLKLFPERRGSERRLTHQAVKVYDSRSGRYLGGIMRNASDSGALLELHGSLAAQIGERVRLAVAGEPEAAAGVVSHERMIPAVVRRFAGTTAATCFVAVEFAVAHAVPKAA